MPEVHAFSTIPAKILLPIDFSPSSHLALEEATVLAQHFHAEVYLVHVVQEGCALDEAKKEAEDYFAVSVAGLNAKGIKTSSSVEVENDIAGAILDVIEREHIDLIVVSTHGTTGWHPLVFGSIAEKLVKLVHIPLLLVRTEKPESSAKVKSGRLMEWW
ncbi:MAG: universal stress protein [Terracidiphilus sp.]|jgi:nucleotide-binding universal stress UspA family protein